jgi:hypothetical protein
MLNTKGNNMVEQTIQNVLDFFNLKANIMTKPFKHYADIPSRHNGIYILNEGDTVIYVGKGQIKVRQSKHWQKAHNELKAGTTDTDGWRWLRENVEISPKDWTLNYIILQKQTERSAVEGALIHLLQPLANDETFKDNERTLKG